MQSIGPLGVHYAARCGSLDAISCLLSNYGNICFYDENGWVNTNLTFNFFNKLANLSFLWRIRDDSSVRKLLFIVGTKIKGLGATNCKIKFILKFINFILALE